MSRALTHVRQEEIDSWSERFFRILRENDLATRSFDTLLEKGIHPMVLVESLWNYTNSESFQWLSEQEARKMRSFVAAARRMCRLFRAGLVEMPTLRSSTWAHFIDPIEMRRMTVINEDGTRNIKPPSVEGPLEKILEMFCTHLEREAERLDREYFSRKNPAFRRELLLAMLVEFAEKTAGRPHYPDFANLLEIAYLASGKSIDVDPDNLEKACKRFNRAHPKAKELAILTVSDAMAGYESRIQGKQPTERTGDFLVQDHQFRRSQQTEFW